MWNKGIPNAHSFPFLLVFTQKYLELDTWMMFPHIKEFCCCFLIQFIIFATIRLSKAVKITFCVFLCVRAARYIPGLMTRSRVDGGWPRFAWSKERQGSDHSLSKYGLQDHCTMQGWVSACQIGQSCDSVSIHMLLFIGSYSFRIPRKRYVLEVAQCR